MLKTSPWRRFQRWVLHPKCFQTLAQLINSNWWVILFCSFLLTFLSNICVIYLIVVHTTKIMNHTFYIFIYLSIYLSFIFHHKGLNIGTQNLHSHPTCKMQTFSVYLYISMTVFLRKRIYNNRSVNATPRTIFQTNLFGFCICFLATLRICRYHKQFFGYPFDFSCLLLTTDLFPIWKLFACRDSLLHFWLYCMILIHITILR